MELIDFTFNPYALLSFLAVVTNIVVLYFIFSEGLEVPTNRWFSLSVFPMIVWGLTEVFSRLSATAVGANFWETLGSLGWIFSSPLFLAFTIAYIGKEKLLSKISFQALLFGPALIFLFLSWKVGLVVNQDLATYHRLSYDWVGVLDAPLFGLVFAWIDLLFIIAFGLLFRFWRNLKDRRRKTQTLLILLGFLVPLVGGSITNGVLPVLGIYILRIAVPLSTVLYVSVAYAILKYRLFEISPAMVASNIVETMNEIVIVLNPDHFVEFVNNTITTVLGYKKEEVVGQHVKRLVGGDWPLFREKVLQDLDAGKSVSGVELALESSSGKKIPVSFSASLLKDPRGRVFGEVGIATDIREIRNLLTDVTAERNKLTTVMGSIVDGVLALDFESNVILVNPATLAMLGFSKEDILNKKLDNILIMFDGDRRILSKDLLPTQKLVKDTIVVQKKDLKITTSFGKQIFVNLTSSSIREGEEVGLGAIITLNDVSKEKELEEMRLDFVSMAAHELRTPLTAIRGYLSVLQEEVAKSLPKEQKSFLDKAFISSSQLASLVENLLSVSRIERGAMKLDIVSAEWDQILTEATNNFMPLAAEKGVSLSLKCPKDLPSVMVDKFRISEVLSNLIGNAIAYTKRGGDIEVTVEEDQGRGEITTHVKDTGQGIPESALPRLFTKFFRVSGILEQGSKGTGLGLYISKAIIDMHKGKIWVESKLGVGSNFSFTVQTVGSGLDGVSKREPLSADQKTANKDFLYSSPSSVSGMSVPASSGNKNVSRPAKPKRFFKRKKS